jgi:hypothetical protein
VVPTFENSKPFACSRAQDSNKGWSNIAEMGETNAKIFIQLNNQGQVLINTFPDSLTTRKEKPNLIWEEKKKNDRHYKIILQ